MPILIFHRRGIFFFIFVTISKDKVGGYLEQSWIEYLLR
jgi:hypothetical protein